jgi:hypothetical protein
LPALRWIEQSRQSGSDLDAKNKAASPQIYLASSAEGPIHPGL